MKWPHQKSAHATVTKLDDGFINIDWKIMLKSTILAEFLLQLTATSKNLLQQMINCWLGHHHMKLSSWITQQPNSLGRKYPLFSELLQWKYAGNVGKTILSHCLALSREYMRTPSNLMAEDSDSPYWPAVTCCDFGLSYGWNQFQFTEYVSALKLMATYIWHASVDICAPEHTQFWSVEVASGERVSWLYLVAIAITDRLGAGCKPKGCLLSTRCLGSRKFCL